MTIEITKENIGEVVINGSWDIEFSVKEGSDSDVKKEGTLRFNFKDVPLADVIASSLKDKRINWQSVARKSFPSIKDGINEVEYGSAKRTPVNEERTTENFLMSMPQEQRIAYLKEKGII